MRSRLKGKFYIDIMDNQNATWQGRVTWVDGQKTLHFRSALELLKLIDGAINQEEIIGGGCHEE